VGGAGVWGVLCQSNALVANAQKCTAGVDEDGL
jgi:hypothetical protein